MSKDRTTAEPAIQLDATDLKLLRLLQEDARATVKELAQKVGLSTTPVHQRVQRLEQQGIIKQYVAIVDSTKLGKGLMVIVYLSLRQHSKGAGNAFIKAMHALPEVVECLTISGQFDFMLKVVAASMQDYYDFHVQKLGQLENIGNVQSVFVMGVVKQTGVQV